MKKFAGDIFILHMGTINHNHTIYGSWDTERDRQNFLSLWAIFCPFTTPTPTSTSLMIPKIKILKEKIIKDIILLYIHVYHKWRSYNNIWFLKYKVRQTESFVILDHFLPFQPPNNPENQNLKIEKNTWRHCHFTNFHDKWQSYDVCSWDMERNRQNFLSFWTVFCPFTPLCTQKIKILKKQKTQLKMLSFTNVYHKWQSYDVSFLRYRVQQTEFLLFWTIFYPFISLTTQKIKIL